MDGLKITIVLSKNKFWNEEFGERLRVLRLDFNLNSANAKLWSRRKQYRTNLCVNFSWQKLLFTWQKQNPWQKLVPLKESVQFSSAILTFFNRNSEAEKTKIDKTRSNVTYSFDPYACWTSKSEPKESDSLFLLEVLRIVMKILARIFSHKKITHTYAGIPKLHFMFVRMFHTYYTTFFKTQTEPLNVLIWRLESIF